MPKSVAHPQHPTEDWTWRQEAVTDPDGTTEVTDIAYCNKCQRDVYAYSHRPSVEGPAKK